MVKAVVIAVASGVRLGRVARGILWFVEYAPYVVSYFDDPKTLEELRESARSPRPGYDIHHVSEKEAAREAGFSESQIFSFENEVSIPTLKHWQITAWYMTKNEKYGMMSPRSYLRDKSWEERQQVGHYALRKYGVLKP